MGTIETLGNNVAWRRYVTDGVPSSGEQHPAKDDIQAFVTAVGGATQIQTGTGAVERTAAARLLDSISVLDFIPVNLHAAIKARTTTTPL